MTTESAEAWTGDKYAKETRRGYESDFKQFLNLTALSKDGALVGPAKLREFSTAQAGDYLSALEGQEYSKASIARKISVVRSVYRRLFGAEAEAMAVFGLKPPLIEKLIPKAITGLDVTALLRAAGQGWAPERDRAMIYLISECGLRLVEVSALDVGDLRLGSTKTAMIGAREIALPKTVSDAMSRWLQRRGDLNLPEPVLRAQGPIFLNRFGGRMSTNLIRRILRGHAAHAGLDQCCMPRALRHGFVATRLKEGVKAVTIRQLMGNKSYTQTARRIKQSMEGN